MKVWVIYADMGCDGNSHPLKVFSSEGKALEYCRHMNAPEDKDRSYDEEYDYVELEVNDESGS